MYERIDRTVVILLSDKRSGSTMLQRELCGHSKIQPVRYSPHKYLETHHWLKAAVLLGYPGELFDGGKVYPGYGSRSGARAYLVDCIAGNVPGFQVPAGDRDLVFQGWETLCDQFAQPVFFEKSPQLLANWAGLSLLLEWIFATSFRVKVIGLVRNPLSVQYSAYQLFHTRPEVRQFGWLNAHKNLLAFQQFLGSEQYLQLRYEDLVESPAVEFSKVCNFIGVDHEDAVGSGVNTDSLEKWKTDPSFAVSFSPPLFQMAGYFGYSVEDLGETHPGRVQKQRVSVRGFINWLKLLRARFYDRVWKPISLRIRSGD